MVEIETKLSGNITEALERFEAKIKGQVLLSGVAAMANVIYDEVKINAGRHKKTGTLEGAIYRAYSPETSTDDQKKYHVSVNKRTAPHWHFLEYGTSKQAATPFIRPALDQMPRAIKAGTDRMKERLGE